VNLWTTLGGPPGARRPRRRRRRRAHAQTLDAAIRNTYQQAKVGPHRRTGFDRAHASASVVGGPGERINLFPTHWTVNRGAGERSMAAMERQFSSWLDTRPGSYDMEMDITYARDGKVPTLVEAAAYRNAST